MSKYQVGDIHAYKDKDPYFDSYHTAMSHASEMAKQGTCDNVFVGVWEYPGDNMLPELLTIVNHDPHNGVMIFGRVGSGD